MKSLYFLLSALVCFLSIAGESLTPNSRVKRQFVYLPFQSFPHYQHRYEKKIPGIRGIDFPALTSIPKTNFNCKNVPIVPKRYADVESGCQVFHECLSKNDGPGRTYICPTGTIFDDELSECDYWYNVKCVDISTFFTRRKSTRRFQYLREISSKNAFRPPDSAIEVPPD